jgi:hypothetical protein
MDVAFVDLGEPLNELEGVAEQVTTQLLETMSTGKNGHETFYQLLVERKKFLHQDRR